MVRSSAHLNKMWRSLGPSKWICSENIRGINFCKKDDVTNVVIKTLNLTHNVYILYLQCILKNSKLVSLESDRYVMIFIGIYGHAYEYLW
jgi:hypothetical protein